ncbi:MAG: DUF3489 domain-containing protein [Bauldia sp.]
MKTITTTATSDGRAEARSGSPHRQFDSIKRAPRKIGTAKRVSPPESGQGSATPPPRLRKARDARTSLAARPGRATTAAAEADTAEASAGRTKGTGSTASIAASAVPTITTKKATCIALLSRTEGASIEELMQATGWQAHSVRGFLSGEVRKRLGLELTSTNAKDGNRRYRIGGAGAA